MKVFEELEYWKIKKKLVEAGIDTNEGMDLEILGHEFKLRDDNGRQFDDQFVLYVRRMEEETMSKKEEPFYNKTVKAGIDYGSPEFWYGRMCRAYRCMSSALLRQEREIKCGQMR